MQREQVLVACYAPSCVSFHSTFENAILVWIFAVTQDHLWLNVVNQSLRMIFHCLQNPQARAEWRVGLNMSKRLRAPGKLGSGSRRRREFFYFVPIIRLAGPGMRTRLLSAKPASLSHAAYSGSL
jgi:hypothetical protein